jgi:hypothetical protein
MLKKFTEIASAWITAANPSNEEKRIAEIRAAICNSCEHRKENTTIIDFYYCDLCGCPLNKKIFAQDKTSCPENKWTE